MKQEKINIEYTFLCDQKWDKMTKCQEGRFCNACQKPVHDLTKLNQLEINELLRKNNNHLCGTVFNDQLENPFPIEYRTFGIKKYLSGIAAIFLLQISQVKAQTTTEMKMEQHDSVSTNHQNNAEISSIDDQGNCENSLEKKKEKKYFKIGRSNYYFTKQFPFIRKKRPRLIGKINSTTLHF